MTGRHIFGWNARPHRDSPPMCELATPIRLFWPMILYISHGLKRKHQRELIMGIGMRECGKLVFAWCIRREEASRTGLRHWVMPVKGLQRHETARTRKLDAATPIRSERNGLGIPEVAQGRVKPADG